MEHLDLMFTQDMEKPSNLSWWTNDFSGQQEHAASVEEEKEGESAHESDEIGAGEYEGSMGLDDIE